MGYDGGGRGVQGAFVEVGGVDIREPRHARGVPPPVQVLLTFSPHRASLVLNLVNFQHDII